MIIFVLNSLVILERIYTGKDEKASVPILITGAFGVIAGAASVFGNTPVDVVKTRMQVSDLR
jgi:solute carrier family 25 citrate transporter 1